jgi:hypothetical protein
MFPPDGRRGPHGALPLDVVIGHTLRSVFATSDKRYCVNFGQRGQHGCAASLLGAKVFPSFL